MSDWMHSLGVDLWATVSGAVFFLVMLTGMQMRVLWIVFAVALTGACASLVVAAPDAANIWAWHFFSAPFALFPIVAGWQNRSLLLPLMVAVIGAALSCVAYLRAYPPTAYLAVFPLLTIVIAYGLYGFCRVMRPATPPANVPPETA